MLFWVLLALPSSLMARENNIQLAKVVAGRSRSALSRISKTALYPAYLHNMANFPA